MANQLAGETSPYLLQHADNPVDWYPWGDKALSRAKTEDKPIFLSIGYSACHWCHVMAHESFEDERIARILNEQFVSIKVDREERPDLDRIYMAAVQALTGRGGWPMSVFLTPEGTPFYGGTYFPPTARYGMPSFSSVLRSIADAWATRRDEVTSSAAQLHETIRRDGTVHRASTHGQELTENTLIAAVGNLASTYDAVHGGWGGAPKFPQPMVLEFLLRHHHRTGDVRSLQMVTRTLDAMARGGMYDQIGGGFHRYSVDDRWLVPHFEKMLYDNAQLARIYLHAYQVTGEPLFRAIVEETLDYVARDMLDPSGGFYSAQDADSEGKEGVFYVWAMEEVRDALGNDAQRFRDAYSITTEGNFEGKNILTFSGSAIEREALSEARQKLLAAREKRIRPGKDDKVLTSWNGLMLAAFAEAAQALDRADYARIAQRNADFLLNELRTSDSRLLRTWRNGTSKINGYLEDYSHLIEGLLAMHFMSLDPRWYLAARELAEVVIEHFVAPTGFWDTSDDHEALIVRPRELQDNAVPSGNAMAIGAFLKLAKLAQDERYTTLARDTLLEMQAMVGAHPSGFAQWLIALDFSLSHHHEIAVIGPKGSPDTEALLSVCRSGYQPHRVVATGNPSLGVPTIPLVSGHPLKDGRSAAYVCRENTCYPPVSEPADLEALLAREG